MFAILNHPAFLNYPPSLWSPFKNFKLNVIECVVINTVSSIELFRMIDISVGYESYMGSYVDIEYYFEKDNFNIEKL